MLDTSSDSIYGSGEEVGNNARCGFDIIWDERPGILLPEKVSPWLDDSISLVKLIIAARYRRRATELYGFARLLGSKGLSSFARI